MDVKIGHPIRIACKNRTLHVSRQSWFLQSNFIVHVTWREDHACESVRDSELQRIGISLYPQVPWMAPAMGLICALFEPCMRYGDLIQSCFNCDLRLALADAFDAMMAKQVKPITHATTLTPPATEPPSPTEIAEQVEQTEQVQRSSVLINLPRQ